MKKSIPRLHSMRRRGLRASVALILASTLSAPMCVAASPASPETAGPQSRLVQPQVQGWLARAQQMFETGNYQGATDQLRSGILAEPDADIRLQAKVLLMRSLLMMRDPECLSLAEEIISDQGTSPAGCEALLTKADWYFFNADYGMASLCYAELPDIAAKPLYAYRQGVSLLRCGKFDSGVRLLQPLANGNSQYSVPAKFYLAWADYARGRLDQALNAFQNVAGSLPRVNENSRGADDLYLPSQLEAGYFIAQIEFRQRHYAEVAERARTLLRQHADRQYSAELNRMAGESLFKLGDYARAEPYLEAYMRSLDQDQQLKSSAAYALGAIAYADGRDDSAVSLLEPIASEPSEEGQGASLLMGQIAASRGDYTAAALYFEQAWRDGADASVAERAMYNHIAATAQGASTPFASATALPERFLQLFPGSEFEAPVREYLSAAYFRDKDYVRALESLDKITRPTASQQAARQLVLYELGASEVSNGQYTSAETHLRRALTGPDAKVTAQSRLWLGQALYAQGKFKEAEQAYRTYLRAEPQGANAAQATYDAAYALYMQDDFKNAAQEFDRALAMKALPARLRTDATVRLADCYYYLRQYARAAQLYAEAETQADGDKAYAAMRAAMMQGLRGDVEAEISGLQRMCSAYPDSRWRPAAMYELATAQAKAGDTRQAAATYSDLAARYPQLEEGRRAQLQLANLYAKTGQDSEAIDAYKAVISRWPTGEEAKAANVELRRLMAERGQIAEYAAFLNSVPGAPKVDGAELERLAFEAADNRLIASAADTAPMLEYLNQYPDGLNVAAGLWRLAQAYDEQGQYAKALDAIHRLQTGRPDAQQLPEALILRGQIIEDHYPARAAEALQAYRQAEQLLGANTPQELYAGIMRLSDNPSEQLDYARRLRAMGGLSSEQAQEADFFEAQALAARGDYEAAAKLYKSLSAQPSSIYGARGAVAYGQMLLDRKKYKEAEKVLTSFTDAGTPHAYWLARGYIALADAVAAQGRKSLARQYLNALKSNYPGTESDIRTAIADRLARL